MGIECPIKHTKKKPFLTIDHKSPTFVTLLTSSAFHDLASGFWMSNIVGKCAQCGNPCSIFKPGQILLIRYQKCKKGKINKKEIIEGNYRKQILKGNRNKMNIVKAQCSNI